MVDLFIIGRFCEKSGNPEKNHTQGNMIDFDARNRATAMKKQMTDIKRIYDKRKN